LGGHEEKTPWGENRNETKESYRFSIQRGEEKWGKQKKGIWGDEGKKKRRRRRPTSKRRAKPWKNNCRGKKTMKRQQGAGLLATEKKPPVEVGLLSERKKRGSRGEKRTKSRPKEWRRTNRRKPQKGEFRKRAGQEKEKEQKNLGKNERDGEC